MELGAEYVQIKRAAAGAALIRVSWWGEDERGDPMFEVVDGDKPTVGRWLSAYVRRHPHAGDASEE